MNSGAVITLKVVEIKMENFYVRKWIKMMNVLWFICHDFFNSRNILEDKLNLLCLKSVVNMHQQYISKKEENDCQTLGWTGSNRIHGKQREPTRALIVLQYGGRNKCSTKSHTKVRYAQSCMFGYVWNALQIARTKQKSPNFFFGTPLHGALISAKEAVCTLHGPGSQQKWWWMWRRSKRKKWTESGGGLKRNFPRLWWLDLEVLDGWRWFLNSFISQLEYRSFHLQNQGRLQRWRSER